MFYHHCFQNRSWQVYVDVVQFCMYLLLNLLTTNHFEPGVNWGLKQSRISEGAVRHHLLCIHPLTETVMILSLVRSFDLVQIILLFSVRWWLLL